MKATLTVAALGLALLSQQTGSRAPAMAPVSPMPIAVLAAVGDAARGQELYESRCIACHSVDANRVGPKHRGVFGRKAGGAADYGYSDAVRMSPVVWTAETLDRWLENPQKLIPGQRMNFRVREAADRSDLIAYLKSVSVP